AELTPAGRRACEELGIDLAGLESQRRVLCRPCLDWSVRRPHLAGALGAALLERCLALGWARRVRDSRVVSFSPRGERALRQRFGAGGAGSLRAEPIETSARPERIMNQNRNTPGSAMRVVSR